MKRVIKKQIGKGFRGKVVWVDHHKAHAVSAYYLSSFEKADILVVDGFGEYEATAPLMTFFVYQEAIGKYHIKVSCGRTVLAAARADRKKAVLESAQTYAADLARFASEHPFEWHHFEPFLGKKINKKEP